jgi:hypothetical protein
MLVQATQLFTPKKFFIFLGATILGSIFFLLMTKISWFYAIYAVMCLYACANFNWKKTLITFCSSALGYGLLISIGMILFAEATDFLSYIYAVACLISLAYTYHWYIRD